VDSEDDTAQLLEPDLQTPEQVAIDVSGDWSGGGGAVASEKAPAAAAAFLVDTVATTTLDAMDREQLRSLGTAMGIHEMVIRGSDEALRDRIREEREAAAATEADTVTR
jgi:hypothetical protein